MVVAASVGAKVLLNQQPSAHSGDAAFEALRQQAKAFLQAAGFVLQADGGMMPDSSVPASVGSWRVIVANASPEGWLEAALDRLAEEDDRQPVWVKWWELQRRGFASFSGGRLCRRSFTA